MSMCRVFSCVVGRGWLLWPVHFLGKTLLVFALLHSVFQGQIYQSYHKYNIFSRGKCWSAIKLRCSRLHRENISKPESVSLTSHTHTHTHTHTHIFLLQEKPELVPERLGRVNQITVCGVKEGTICELLRGEKHLKLKDLQGIQRNIKSWTLLKAFPTTSLLSMWNRPLWWPSKGFKKLCQRSVQEQGTPRSRILRSGKSNGRRWIHRDKQALDV